MPSRTRTLSGVQTTGLQRRVYIGGATGIPDLTTALNGPLGVYVQTTDIVGDYPNDHPFFSNRREWEIGALAGSYTSGSYRYQYEGYPVPSVEASPAGIINYIVDPVSNSARAATVAARSNPSRPVVDLPVALFELKDIPRMIKQAGEAIHWVRKTGLRTLPTAEGLANANLAYQFGWAPLLSDLYKLLKFQEHFEKKRKILERLYSGTGLRRNITLDEFSESTNGTYTHSIGFGSMTTSWTIKRTTKVWGTIRWKPKNLPPGGRSPSDLEVYRATLGLDITLATVWEAIPWSWLIDWFTSAGDYLSAHRNTIPASFSNICIMRLSEHVGQITPISIPNGRTWGGATLRSTKKERTPHVGLTPLTAAMPFLGARQLSILGSLAITRGLHKP
jgi:hypothetical protein